jgi:hypothetical protein
VQASSWWEPVLKPALSQGDVVQKIPFCGVTAPAKFLKWTAFKGNRSGWEEVTAPVLRLNDQRKYFLANGDILPGIVVSHDCDLDKQRENGKVLLAPIAAIQTLALTTRLTVLEQKHLALLPLPLVPGLGDSYADLRLIASVPRELVLDSERLVSMNQSGVERLYAQLFKFMMRREPALPEP